MSTVEEKHSNVLTAVAISAAAGTLLGVLVAPKSGRDVRSQIKGKLDNLRGKAKDSIDEAVKSKNELVDKAKTVASNVKQQESLAK